MTFNKIISLCEKHGFFRKIFYEKLNLEILNIESTGALLLNNLRNEWFDNVVINKDLSVFFNTSDFSETFEFAKETCLHTPPFGVAEVYDKPEKSLIPQENDDKIDFESLFEKSSMLKCSVFVATNSATQFFHQWQRQRRTWWRQFAASPGRYFLTDIRNNDAEGLQNVEIIAKYPWGDQLIEKITLCGKYNRISQPQLQLKFGKKSSVEAQCVVSEICSSTMLLNTICDAYEEPLFQDNSRPLLRLHRKLAPYKISFAIVSSQKSVVDELRDLALYLCRQLRANHVSCLLIPAGYKNTLEAQWRQYDQLGVPYSVVLNEKTLKTGIAQMRSRDTTLKEQVHVTDLPGYVEKLFRNY